MDWIEFKKKKPENNKTVEVELSNGKIVHGKLQGNWWSYNPKDVTFDDIKAKVVRWRYVEPTI